MAADLRQRAKVGRLRGESLNSRNDYKSAGVDIEAGNEAVRRIKSHVSKTHSSAVLTGLGSFGTLFSMKDALAGMSDPVLVQSTDGVGTKTKVTVMAGRYEALGRDLVAAVAGDIVVMGATPLTFLDYLGLHKTEPAIVAALVRGMSDACAEAGIALVGGETAEMPSVYAPGELDVVGFVTGVVERDKVLDGSTIHPGDVLYAVSSSGLHTNGFSLARKLIFELADHSIHDTPDALGGASIADVLLEPHVNYVAPVRDLLRANLGIKGIAHITGGGLVENTPRVLPLRLSCVIDRSTWTPQPVFRWMQQLGDVDDLEMYRTFNMGVGLVLVAGAGRQQQLAAVLARYPKLSVWELGRVVEGDFGTEFAGV